MRTRHLSFAFLALLIRALPSFANEVLEIGAYATVGHRHHDTLEENVAHVSSITNENSTILPVAVEDSSSIDDTVCGLWLAPSTIPGAGLGMYAGRNYQKNEAIQSGEYGDIVIPIVDLRLHHNGQFTFLWDEYTWNGENLLMDHEGFHDINIASPGFGAAANCFLPLLNVDEWNPFQDYAGLHRSVDPGAGAYSAYYNRTTTASRDITIGQELFVSYGEQWFVGREHLGPIPLTQDLDTAMNLFRQYQQFEERNKNRIPENLVTDIWNLFVRQTAFKDSRVLQSFNHSDLLEIKNLQHQNLTEIRIEQSSRTLEWLHKHGTCADHIRPGLSTLDQAGRGAFASRFLPQHSVVSHLPLIHIFDRSILEMYHIHETETGEKVPDPSLGVQSYQLLLNYCFGHGSSSLLLCPYAPMADYINHNKSQANVKIQWSDRGNHMPELMKMDLAELDTSWTAKLAMDLVATRDIFPGEEIFLDYGDEWEKAWQKHLESWEPVEDADYYLPAKELNNETEYPFRTAFEEVEDPMPHVQLWCNDAFLNRRWKRAYMENKMQEFANETPGRIHRCDILRFKEDPDKNGTFLYTAVLWHDENNQLDMIGKFTDVPREAFVYYDLPYTTDMHMPNAFRHDIRIPDAIFPEAWKNYATDQTSSPLKTSQYHQEQDRDGNEL